MGLSPEFQKICEKVICKIYEIEYINNEHPRYSEVVKCFENEIPKDEVSKAFDFMSDICMIYAQYEEINENLASYCYHIDKMYLESIKQMYENMKGD